jgi:hypothetical protein
MDRDGHRRAQQRDGAGGALGVEVAGPQARAPAPHRQQRGVEAVRADALHAREQVGVAGEVHADAPARHDEPERGAALARQRAAPRVVAGGRGARDHVAAHGDLVAAVDLEDLERRTRAPQHPGGPARADHARARGQPAQRRAVEVVAVQVRDQDGVDAARQRRGRSVADEVADARAEHRVREEPCAGDVDEDGRVPEPGQLRRGRHGRRVAIARVGGSHPRRVIRARSN